MKKILRIILIVSAVMIAAFVVFLFKMSESSKKLKDEIYKSVEKESGIKITFGDKTNELELARIVDKNGYPISVTEFCKEYENENELKIKYKKDSICDITLKEIQLMKIK